MKIQNIKLVPKMMKTVFVLILIKIKLSYEKIYEINKLNYCIFILN